jgi:hypothetical protein
VTMRSTRPSLLSGMDSLVNQAKLFLREQDYAPRRTPTRR